MSLFHAGAWLVAGLGIVAALLAAASTRVPRAGLPMMLELWTAAGLLRLSGDVDAPALAVVATLVVARQLVVRSSRRRDGAAYARC